MLNKIKKIFKNNEKPHLLIVGNDLKFITPAIKYLKTNYEVKINEIQPDTNLNSSQNKKLLNWADIIFCEWMESYAEWYSKNVKNNQKLFIRAHKYEIARDFGYKINFNNVTGVITINYFLLELFSNIFSIPREKMFVLNNIIETSHYLKNKTPDYRRNIAVVGYAPNWKGYLRSLEILNNLIKYDDFKLYLFGKDWYEIEWIQNDVEQFEYLNTCEEFIKKNNLEKHIIKQGWIERSEMFSNIGFVLSVSDIEGSHLSPTEAFADLTISALINWPGVSYIYPKEITFKSIEEITDYILNTYNNDSKYMKTVEILNNYCNNEFSEEYFVNGLIKIFNMKNTDDDKFSISFNKIKTEFIENDKINDEKLLNEFENSFIVDNTNEVENILKNNPKRPIRIFLSDNIENYQIKNIYQKYASNNIGIYSIHFLENLNEAEKFIELANKYHKSNKKLK